MLMRKASTFLVVRLCGRGHCREVRGRHRRPGFLRRALEAARHSETARYSGDSAGNEETLQIPLVKLYDPDTEITQEFAVQGLRDGGSWDGRSGSAEDADRWRA